MFRLCRLPLVGVIPLIACLADPGHRTASAQMADEVSVSTQIRSTLRQVEVVVEAPRGWAGRVLGVRHGERVLGELAMDVDPATARARGVFLAEIPLRSEECVEPLRVLREGEEVGRTAMPDTRSRRIAEVMRAKWHTHGIFAEDEFPEVELEPAGWIEHLLGPVRSTVRFFDNDHREVKRPHAGSGRYGAVLKIEAQGIEPLHRYLTLYRSEGTLQWERMKVEVELPEWTGVSSEVMRAGRSAVNEMAQWEMADRFEHQLHAAALLGVMRYASPADAPYVADRAYWNQDEVWWIGLKKKLGLFEHRYLRYLPEGYEADAGVKWPLLLYLHDAPGRGRELGRVERAGLPAKIKAGLQVPAIVIAPQIDTGRFWVPAEVDDLLTQVMEGHRVDPERVVVIGSGMGAAGAWYAVTFYPGRFSASAVVGGSGEATLAGRIRDLPMRVFELQTAGREGGPGGSAGPTPTRVMYDAVRSAGGERSSLSVIPLDPGQAGPEAERAAADRVLTDPALIQWLVSQRRGTGTRP